VRVGALPDDASLAARRLGLFTIGLYAAPDYLARHGPILAPAQLAGLHGLLTGPLDVEPRPWTLQHADGRRWQGQPATSTRANSPDLPMRLARAGLGVTALPDFYLEADAVPGAVPPPAALQRVLPDWALPPVPVWAVFPGRRLLPTRARLFIDALAATAGRCTAVAEPGAALAG
jgi:DNA-binding transcriptional LysR family regulator